MTFSKSPLGVSLAALVFCVIAVLGPVPARCRLTAWPRRIRFSLVVFRHWKQGPSPPAQAPILMNPKPASK